MEPSTIESPENRADDQTRWEEVISRKRTMRALLGVEGISFVLSAMIHAGMLVQGYAHREAMIAESVIGAVLLVGLTVTWIRPRVMFSIAAVVQGFALLVSLIGAWTIIVGVGPRTVPDIIYHGIIIIVLVVGLGVAWRARGTESDE